MKCNNCGYSLQIEDVVCPSCGTPNPYGKEHRENMERYTQEFKDTQDAVINRTQKTTGVLVKFLIALVLIVASVVIIIFSSSSSLSDKKKINKVRNNLEQYRAQYNEIEASGDYIYLDEWFEANYLNKVPEFSDCLNVFNVCMYYRYLASEISEVTYPEYIENAVRDTEGYCEFIISSYDQMCYYAGKEMEKDTVDEGHRKCIDSCMEKSRVLIQGVFKLTDEQMQSFDEVTANKRIGMLLENWPYEE